MLLRPSCPLPMFPNPHADLCSLVLSHTNQVIGAPLEVQTITKIDDHGRIRTESIVDDAVLAFQSSLKERERKDPLGIALDRRRRMRCGVAGSCMCWPKCYHLCGCKGNNWSEADIYYKSLTEWDERRIDPRILARLDGVAVQAPTRHGSQISVLAGASKGQEASDSSDRFDKVMLAARDRFKNSIKDGTSGEGRRALCAIRTSTIQNFQDRCRGERGEIEPRDDSPAPAREQGGGERRNAFAAHQPGRHCDAWSHLVVQGHQKRSQSFWTCCSAVATR